MTSKLNPLSMNSTFCICEAKLMLSRLLEFSEYNMLLEERKLLLINLMTCVRCALCAVKNFQRWLSFGIEEIYAGKERDLMIHFQ